MNSSDIPAKFPIPFANAATATYTRQVPTGSQIGVNDGAASLTDGFPPLTFLPQTAGGVPPDGRDVNGILAQATAWARWQAAGGPIRFDNAFATAVGGYPLGATLQSTTAGVVWQSTVQGNLTDPDGGSSAGWIQISTPAGNDPHYIRLPGGKIDQWGYDAGPYSGGTHAVNFAVPYVGAGSINIQLTVYNIDPGAADNIFAQLLSFNTSGFVYQLRFAGSGSPLIDGVHWRAIGV